MNVFVSSVTNIKYWMRSDAIIPKTLQLLSDLSVGYPFKVLEDFRVMRSNAGYKSKIEDVLICICENISIISMEKTFDIQQHTYDKCA